MAQPINATLITNPVRPNDELDLIASAFANEIKGGHHGYATLTLRNSIIEARREWGMLCTIYNDGANNGTYQLTYNASSTTITDNNNWKPFSGTIQTVGGGGEWFPSVLSVVDTEPGSPSGGDRYLIATPSYALLATHSTQIVEWDDLLNAGAGDWVYTTPTNGSTVRVDSQNNVIYKFQGTYSEGGLWYKEYLTQTRYIQPTSLDGSVYTFTSSSDMVALDAYSYSIYLANFGYTSSGASTLQIDGLGSFPMKKISANSKLDISSEDLIPGIQYHISWNDGIFQVHGFGGGASAGVIGPPESTDGTYNDGLFQDFTPSTPIGVPIDRFNEILLALVPPPAPDLSSWSLGGPSFVDGKLSFDGTISGFTAAPGFGIGSLFDSSGYRKGINSLVSQPRTGATYYNDITGILNSTVATGPGDPTPAYPRYAFGNGITGSLVLRLNGSTISNVDLSSTYNAINTTGGSDGGLNLSAATSSKFPSGVAFEFFWHRTGTYLIKKGSTLLRSGFNYLDLTHILPSTNLILASYSWVSDNFTTVTSFTNDSITPTTNPTGGVKTLSGIKFFNTGTLVYRVDYKNHVSNTYIATTSALSTTTLISSGPGVVNVVTGYATETNTPIFIAPSSISITTPSSPSTQQTILWSYSINTGSGVRRLNQPVTFYTTVLRTVQGNDTSAGYVDYGWFIDTYGNTSTDSTETFDDETYRLLNQSAKYGQYDTIPTLNWISSSSLWGTPGYKNGLQVVNGMLVYPKFNFNVSDLDRNPNFGGGSPVNYSLCSALNEGLPVLSGGGPTNYRTFTRRFRINPSTNYAELKFKITHTGTTFVNSNTQLNNSTNCWIEVKLPGTSTAVTGWLDMTKPYKTGLSADGDGANKNGTVIPVSEGDWLINFGQKGTVESSGYVLLRITAPSSWSGNISNITLSIPTP
jgi:hypothetical protein